MGEWKSRWAPMLQTPLLSLPTSAVSSFSYNCKANILPTRSSFLSCDRFWRLALCTRKSAKIRLKNIKFMWKQVSTYGKWYYQCSSLQIGIKTIIKREFVFVYGKCRNFTQLFVGWSKHCSQTSLDPHISDLWRKLYCR